MRRAGLLLVAGVTGLALAPPAAAGTYDVLACDAAPGGVNNAWSGSGGASSHYEVDALCPVNGQANAGLRVRDEIGSANAPAGSGGEWTFVAPAATAITGWRYRRWIGKDGDNDWDVHARLGDGTTLDSCTIPLGLPSCEVGAPAGTNHANERTESGFSTTSLRFGVTCAAGSGFTCATGGATIHNAWAHLYSSVVTLTENADPTVDPPSGTLLGGGWRSGSQTVTVAGADPLGIERMRVYVGGALADSIGRGCDHTYSLPCVDPPCTPPAGMTCGHQSAEATHTIDTTQLPDGQRQLEAAVVDAAGNEARSEPVAVAIDNNPPSFSISAPAGETASRTLAVSWSSNDGAGSGSAGHDVEVSVDGGAWQPWLSGTGATGGSYPAETGRTYRFRGRASDVVGHVSGWVESAETRVVEPAAAPCACPPADQAPTGPAGATAGGSPSGDTTERPPVRRRTPSLGLRRVRRRGSRLSVEGSISRSASGRVDVVYRVTVGGRMARVRRSLSVRSGRFRGTVRLSRRLARARRGLLTVSYAGDDTFRPRTVRSRRIR